MDKLLMIVVLVGAVCFLAMSFMQVPIEYDAALKIVQTAREDVASAVASHATCRDNNSNLALEDVRFALRYIKAAQEKFSAEPQGKSTFGGQYAEAVRLAQLASEYARRVHTVCDKKS